MFDFQTWKMVYFYPHFPTLMHSGSNLESTMWTLSFATILTLKLFSISFSISGFEPCGLFVASREPMPSSNFVHNKFHFMLLT